MEFCLFTTISVLKGNCIFESYIGQFVYMADFFTLSQDQGLDVISEGLDTLKNMAGDMNEVSCFCVLLLVYVQYMYTC
jgi:hypothetical protein